MPDEKKYWFPARRYGWGWGAPSTWQGWVALLIYVALMVGGILIWSPVAEGLMYGIYAVLVSLVFVAVCWITGEPPRWRWGGDR